jgi:hypothetical protein
MKDEAVIPLEFSPSIIAGIKRTPAEQFLNAPVVQIVRGFEHVRLAKPMLVQLSVRTGQMGAMDWLDYFLDSPDSKVKTPYLIIIGQPDVDSAEPLKPAEQPFGAVLVYEYRFAGLGTRVFATDDMIGVRTVIAPAEIRAEVAALAIRYLMQMGAVMGLVTLNGPGGPISRRSGAEVIAYRMAKRRRWTPRYLELSPTLDGTLSLLGKHTRRNLRYYRRKLEADLGAEFVPDLQMRRQEFLEMNRRSTNPAPEHVTNWRYDLIERRTPPTDRTMACDPTMFCGLRAADGRWLSLAGGRRHGQTTELDWQLNLAGLARYSLCTAMRCYVIENEIARGAKRLVFEGGTSHPMRFAFTEEETTDLLAVRRFSVRAWLLKHLSRWVFPEKNFLGAALREFRSEEPRPDRSRASSQDLPYAA